MFRAKETSTKTKVQNALGMLKELKGVECKGTVVYSRGEQVG